MEGKHLQSSRCWLLQDLMCSIVERTRLIFQNQISPLLLISGYWTKTGLLYEQNVKVEFLA
jgi:hypothetical protein